MPEHLTLYPSLPEAAIEKAERLSCDSDCSRCALGADTKVRCLPADGGPGDVGDLFIIGESVLKVDATARRPFSSTTGTYLRGLLAKHWPGRVVLDNAVRCPGEVTDAAIAACRPYLAKTLDEVQPKRIITLGLTAAESLLGRRVHPFSTRRGWGWVTVGGKQVPVFFLIPPIQAQRNRFIKEWFESDLRWALTYNPPKPPWNLPVQVISSLEEAKVAVAQLRLADWFAFDVETAGRMYDESFRILSFAAATCDADLCFAWDTGGLINFREPLDRLLLDAAVKKVGQNLKYDLAAIREAWGYWVEGVHGDTRLWRKLLDPEADADLGTLGELVGMGGHKAEAEALVKELAATYKRKVTAHQRAVEKATTQGTLLPNTTLEQDAELRLGADPYTVAYSQLPRDVLLRYNGRDAVATALVGSVLEAQLLQEPNLHRIWEKVVHPASTAIARVERWGVPCSVDALNAFDTMLTTDLVGIQSRLKQYGNINWGSVPQLQKFLYETLGLTPTVRTKTGQPSTNDEALHALKAQHPAVADILDLRFLSKMQGTYANGMREHIRDDGRVHGSINLDGARSGRTSMSDPNLQNIPRSKDSPQGKMAKDCFVAPRGWVMLQADYSQLELRIAALLSGDEEMIAVFRSGVDYHLRTAQLIAHVWSMKPEDVGPVQRTAAKGVNFGVLYGKSDASLAHDLGITVAQAKAIRLAIFGKFQKLAKWIQDQLAAARVSGVAWTVWESLPARRRPLFRMGDQSPEGSGAKATAERSAWNTPIQGTASEFCIASLVRCVRLIEEDGLPAELILPIHDALLFLTPEKHLRSVAQEVKGAMTDWGWLGDLVLEVDLEVGPSWGSLSKYKV